LLGAGIWVIEGLDLSEVEPGEYELICLPIKVHRSDGAGDPEEDAVMNVGTDGHR
jgi:kynurenine formamidase